MAAEQFSGCLLAAAKITGLEPWFKQPLQFLARHEPTALGAIGESLGQTLNEGFSNTGTFKDLACFDCRGCNPSFTHGSGFRFLFHYPIITLQYHFHYPIMTAILHEYYANITPRLTWICGRAGMILRDSYVSKTC